MATTIEISYFNSFWMKTLNREDSANPEGSVTPVWPNGYPYNRDAPAGIGPIGILDPFPGGASATTDGFNINWFIEESRIRGGYNNTQVDLGVKAYLVEEEPQQQHRFNSLIYSGIYNSRTGINNTNEFSVSKDITKSLDPAYGSIQKLFAEDTNMTVLQESKVSRALIDKDAIYSAEGGGSLTSSSAVIGQITPYLGEYGISKNPESFAYYGFQKYFTDKDRGAVLRLSRDGITEISNYGMLDYFRDNLATLDENNIWEIQTGLGTSTQDTDEYIIDVVGVDITNLFYGMTVISNGEILGRIIKINPNGLNGGTVTINNPTSISPTDIVVFQSTAPAKALGRYDIHNKNYILSLQNTPQYVDNANYSTLAFDEMINGWVGFYSYKPSQMFSLKNNFYSMQYANIWRHYSQSTNVNNFYGVNGGANITFIFNKDSSINKVFQTVNYEGDNGWQVDYFISEPTGYDLTDNGWQQFNDQIQNIESYVDGKYTENGVTYYSGFNRKENKYYANLVNTSTAQPGEVVFGEQVSGIKGRFATVKFSTDTSTNLGGAKELWSVGTKVNYIR
jgi:hypothetical protein